MYICFVRHEINGVDYLFDCTAFHEYLNFGIRVLCDTVYGKQSGRLSSGVIEISTDNDSFNMLCRCCRAYTPLKSIAGIQPFWEDEAKESNEIKWFQSMVMHEPHIPLPF